MVDAVKFNISGTERVFHFNNFALVELGKIFEVDPIEAPDKLMEMAGEDVFMALTIVLTSGFIGWEKSQFNLKHGITPKLIASEIATCDMNDLAPAWDAFKNATGISEFLAAQVKEQPVVESEEPKKKPRSKASLSTQ